MNNMAGNTVNRQKELIETLQDYDRKGIIPSILLHACCAPCASSCLEVLDRYADITVFFYNPNITVREEYEHRLNELYRLVREMEFCHKVSVIAADHDPDSFFAIAEGLENEPERGKRCLACYEQRLKATAELAAKGGYDRFATTLTLSPLKPSRIINEIGITLSPQLYLPSDFKKNNGYLRSIELSRKYDLYRQDYCGCIYSRRRD